MTHNDTIINKAIDEMVNRYGHESAEAIAFCTMIEKCSGGIKLLFHLCFQEGLLKTDYSLEME